MWQYGIATENKKINFFPLVAMCGNTWRYRIATEIEKMFFSTFFLGGDVWRYRTVSPQKLKNLVFFNFFFWWRCVAIPYGIATEIEKSCFFQLFFWWRCVAIPYGIATEIEKSCFFQLFFLVAMCGDTARYRHRN